MEMYHQIEAVLEHCGYKKIALNVSGIHLALRRENSEGYAVVTVDETKGTQLTREQFYHISEQIRDFLRKKECFYTHFLYLLVSDNDESARRLFQGQECFWRIVPYKKQLMVFETIDDAFLVLRRPLEELFPGEQQKANSNDYRQQQTDYHQNQQYRQQQTGYNQNQQYRQQQTGYNQSQQYNQQNQGGYWNGPQNMFRNYRARGDMLDIRRVLSQKNLPWCNIIIILLNVLVFFYTDFFALSQNDAIVSAGALGWHEVMENGQWYRLITCMFLHSNIEHIFNNMLILGYVGSCLENQLGKIRYGILYIGAGILAGCASMVYNMMQNNNVISIGASGAIFGVIGAMLFVVLFNRGKESEYNFRQIAVMAFLSLYGGFTSQGVDNAAHFGGFIAGFILAGMLTIFQKKRGA